MAIKEQLNNPNKIDKLKTIFKEQIKETILNGNGENLTDCAIAFLFSQYHRKLNRSPKINDVFLIDNKRYYCVEFLADNWLKVFNFGSKNYKFLGNIDKVDCLV